MTTISRPRYVENLPDNWEHYDGCHYYGMNNPELWFRRDFNDKWQREFADPNCHTCQKLLKETDPAWD